jgi:hypothetical protein
MNKNLDFKKIEVYDKSGNLQIKMIFNNIDPKASFSSKYFSTSENMKSAKIDDSNKDNNKIQNNKIKENNDKNDNKAEKNESELSSDNQNTTIDTKEENNEIKNSDNANTKSNETSLLNETIYPMYLPTGTYLTSEETVSKEEGERTILTFAGENPFILVEEVANVSDESEVIPVYGEPVMLLDSIGALSSNSANFISNGIEYYISGDKLTKEDIINVAESINTITVMK